MLIESEPEHSGLLASRCPSCAKAIGSHLLLCCRRKFPLKTLWNVCVRIRSFCVLRAEGSTHPLKHGSHSHLVRYRSCGGLPQRPHMRVPFQLYWLTTGKQDLFLFRLCRNGAINYRRGSIAASCANCLNTNYPSTTGGSIFNLRCCVPIMRHFEAQQCLPAVAFRSCTLCNVWLDVALGHQDGTGRDDPSGFGWMPLAGLHPWLLAELFHWFLSPFRQMRRS